MDEEACATSVVAECNERRMDLLQLYKEQRTFSKEAFHFLLHNAHLWIEYPADFLLKHTDGGDYTLFTTTIRNAVVARAFMKRIEYKHIMIPKLDDLASPECYERLIVEYPISKNVYYFFNYLEWMSFIYTLTMFCYKEGYDYFQLGQQCLASYSDILYFHLVGGWDHLNEAANCVSIIGRLFKTAILQGEHADENFARVLKARKKHERRYRYESNKWTTLNSGVLPANEVREKMSAKFRVISALDSRRVVSGYKVVINNESSDMLKRNKVDSSKKDEQTFASETHCNIESGSEETVAEIVSSLDLTKISDPDDPFQISSMTECTESENTSGRVVTCDATSQTEPRTFVSRDGSSDSDFKLDKKMVFVIRQRLLRNTCAVTDKDYVHHRGIKVCSPSTNRDYLIGDIEILDGNLRNKTLHHIAEEVLVVCPPGCDYEDEDTTVMVLDTSTEDEDDDEFNAPQLYFMHLVPSQPDTSTEVSQSSVRISHSLSGKSDINVEGSWSSTERPEQREFLPTRSTGAIPKVKTSLQS